MIKKENNNEEIAKFRIAWIESDMWAIQQIGCTFRDYDNRMGIKRNPLIDKDNKYQPLNVPQKRVKTYK